MQTNEQKDSKKIIEAFLDYAIENNFLDGAEIDGAFVKLRSDAEQASLCFNVEDDSVHKETYCIDKDGAEKVLTELISKLRKE